ncbi:ATP-citrate synthase beta chain protein 1 [Cucumis melo var. makuwa]|uniref:ATP-citrate synthase beta chain protein 1 n=1 Tax=Cucumis melo var. makuwa TaxID=1194695 RepID=A0A5A7TCM2_CUCMM|nr:ATP-citrate synthase beta chain protein 1 [Cucumis melo var. makuwa]
MGILFSGFRFLMTDFLWVRKLKLQLTLLPLHFVVNTPRTRGGMSNEMYNNIARVTDGIYEDIAIGGNVFPGSNLLGQNYKKDCAKVAIPGLQACLTTSH